MCPFAGQELKTKDKGCRGCWECILCIRSKSVTLWEAITISRGLSVNCACHYKLLTIPDRKMPNKSPQVKSIEATCRRIFHRGVGLWQNKKFAWFKCHFNYLIKQFSLRRHWISIWNIFLFPTVLFLGFFFAFFRFFATAIYTLSKIWIKICVNCRHVPICRARVEDKG